MPRTLKEFERDVQASIVANLAAIGIRLHRRNVGAREWVDKTGKKRLTKYAAKGQADLYGWVVGNSRHVEIEVKRHGERPTPKQLEWLWGCHRDGAIAFWADGVDVAIKVARAVLAGGVIVWGEDGDFDVEM